MTRTAKRIGVPVLTATDLNRATLARQLLLERSDLGPVAAIEAVAGLQAQEAASPYIGLWTRLRTFEPAELDQALADRHVVKGGLMRNTLHMVTAADYSCFVPALLSIAYLTRRRDRAEPPPAEQFEQLKTIATRFTNEPRSLTEVREHLAEHAPDLPGDELVWWLRRHVPFVHAPSPTVPWSFGRRPRIVHAAAWLRDPAPFATEQDGLDCLAQRYLAAFGPASAADMSQWSGLPVGRLRPAIDRLEAANALEHFTDERGRALIDLVDAPRPPATTPAPPRLLPMWDSPLLAFADRTRIISDADRAIVIAKNGDTLPTFTVDGRVAGLWWAERDPGSTASHIVLEPFRPIAASTRRALEAEAEALAAFIDPHEPRVYARYQRWRPTG